MFMLDYEHLHLRLGDEIKTLPDISTRLSDVEKKKLVMQAAKPWRDSGAIGGIDAAYALEARLYDATSSVFVYLNPNPSEPDTVELAVYVRKEPKLFIHHATVIVPSLPISCSYQKKRLYNIQQCLMGFQGFFVVIGYSLRNKIAALSGGVHSHTLKHGGVYRIKLVNPSTTPK